MKKIVTIIMVLVLTLSFNCNIWAEVSPNAVAPGIDPLLDHMSKATSVVTISGGTARCVGTTRVFKNYTTKMILTLQRSTGDGFSNYVEWTNTFTGAGVKRMEKTKAVTKGCTYRLRTVVVLYNGDKLVEATATYSSRVSY